jgi:mevalonate kinase
MKAVAEAPSKVIITGEHFVVHGAWALAAALPRVVRVVVRESKTFKVTSDRFGGRASELRPVGIVVETMAREFAFRPNLEVTIRSQIPEGAGLGSSASTLVAVASALSRLHSLKLGADEIARLSMVGEQVIHGRPSGIDPAICSRGGVILFRPGSSPRKVTFKGARRLLVSFSGVKRTTKKQITHVSTVKDKFPSMFEGLTESASEVSIEAADRLVEGDMRGLGRLLNFNHAVLSAIGVSNEPLDQLVDLSLSLGSYGAKLTGGGGGGSVVSVAPEAKEKSITTGLKARGFETFTAEVPVQGVRSWLER